MSPFPNVYRRAGSNRWQFALPAPTDLTEHFTTQWAVRKSLGTADLREANAKAKDLHAEWESRFAQLRRGQRPSADGQPDRPAAALAVVDLTPQIVQEAANLLYARTLESDEAAPQKTSSLHLRFAPLAPPSNCRGDGDHPTVK